MTRLTLEHNELASLIKLSTPEQYLPARFGPSGVWLFSEDEGSQWAIDLVEKWRAE